MIDERRCVVTVVEFADYISMRAQFARSKRLHDEKVLTKEEMGFMYVTGPLLSLHPPPTSFLSWSLCTAS
jgi:hypothetical protein